MMRRHQQGSSPGVFFFSPSPSMVSEPLSSHNSCEWFLKSMDSVYDDNPYLQFTARLTKKLTTNRSDRTQILGCWDKAPVSGQIEFLLIRTSDPWQESRSPNIWYSLPKSGHDFRQSEKRNRFDGLLWRPADISRTRARSRNSWY